MMPRRLLTTPGITALRCWDVPGLLSRDSPSARVDVHLISHLLGHSSVLVTEKVYAKLLLPSLSKELNEKLSFLEYGIEK